MRTRTISGVMKRKGLSTNTPLAEVIPQGSRRRDVTELHVHLGGAVPLYRLWEMGIARGIRGVAQSYENFIGYLHRQPDKVEDLDKYLEVFDMVELIQAGPQAVGESITIALNGAYRTGGMRHLGPGGEGGDPEPVFAVSRLELRFNPMKRTGVILSRGGAVGLYDVDRIIRSACEAVEASELAYHGGIASGLIICFGRDLSWEVNRTLAEKVRQWKRQHKKIIGVDLAGPESVLPLAHPAEAERMAELYDIAAGEELGRTIHVGETPHVSIDTFIQTVKALRPHRVSHPVVAARAFWDDGDARGLELLAEMKICCELCVWSNLLTRALGTVEEYGKFLKVLDQFKIPYTFSTDSPALQMTTLAGELELLLSSGAMNAEQCVQALTNADKYTFLK